MIHQAEVKDQEAVKRRDEDRPSVFDGATSGGGGCHIWCRFVFD